MLLKIWVFNTLTTIPNPLFCGCYMSLRKRTLLRDSLPDMTYSADLKSVGHSLRTMPQLGELCLINRKGNKVVIIMAGRNQELKFEIINQLGIISTSSKGWTVEFNRVSWNGKEPKYDVRAWSPDHTKMGKGITLSKEELITLSEMLSKEVEFLRED